MSKQAREKRMLGLLDGSYVAPIFITYVSHFPHKGIAFFNEYGDIIAYIEIKDEVSQMLILDALVPVLNGNGRWQQPDWSAILPGTAKPADQKVTPFKPEAKAS